MPTLLLQMAERVKVALSIVQRAASFDQLRIQRKNLFACTAGCKVRLIRLSGFYLGLRARRLTAQVAIIELQQQLAFADVISFFHQQPLYRCSVR